MCCGLKGLRVYLQRSNVLDDTNNFARRWGVSRMALVGENLVEAAIRWENVQLCDQSSVSFFFLLSLFGSGSPFFGSFLEPGSFS